MGNNPILFNDPLGDTLRGVSAISTIRLKDEIGNSFQGKKFNKLNSLFKVGKDNVTFDKIGNKAFKDATKGLSKDEKALAKGYKTAINSTNTHMVEMTKTTENLSAFSINARGLAAGTTGQMVESSSGGGVNYALGTGSLSIIVINSQQNIDYVYEANAVHYSRQSTSAELVAHEVLGHGLGRSAGSSTFRHNDAIQMTNLYWRVRGYDNFYRDGTRHGPQTILSSTVAQEIPSIFQ